MTTFGQIVGMLVGVIALIQGGGQLDRMSLHTDHFIRIGYYLLTVGGFALIVGPFSDVWWILEAGWILFGIGGAIFLVYGRRENIP